MIYLIIACVLLLASAGFCFWYLEHPSSEHETFFVCAGIFSLGISICLLVIIGFSSFNYVSAGYKAKIINEEFDKNYTQSDVFYAEDVIDEIRHLHRKRIELNGDLLEDK